MGIALELVASKETVEERAATFGRIIGQPFEAIPAANGKAHNYEAATLHKMIAFVDSEEAAGGESRVYFMPQCSELDLASLLGVVCHELGHVVAPMNTATHGDWPIDLAHHNHQWLRAAIHFHYRAQRADFEIPEQCLFVSCSLPIAGNPKPFYQELRGELLDTDCRAPLAHVLASPAPEKFVRLWELSAGGVVSAPRPAAAAIVPQQNRQPLTVTYTNFCGDDAYESDGPVYYQGIV